MQELPPSPERLFVDEYLIAKLHVGLSRFRGHEWLNLTQPGGVSQIIVRIRKRTS